MVVYNYINRCVHMGIVKVRVWGRARVAFASGGIAP